MLTERYQSSLHSLGGQNKWHTDAIVCRSVTDACLGPLPINPTPSPFLFLLVPIFPFFFFFSHHEASCRSTRTSSMRLFTFLLTVHSIIMLYNFLSHIHQTLRLFNPVVSVLCKILDTLRLTIIMARPFEFSSKVTGVIHSVFESFLERNTAQTLDESRHAPPSEDQDIVTSTYSPSTVCFLSLSLSFSSLTTHPPICPFPSSPPFLPPATTASILNVTLLFSVSIIVLSCLFSFYWELMCGSITQKQSSAAGYRTPPVFHTQSPSPSLSSSYHSNISDSHTSSGEKPPAKMYPIADVDDTAGFMAAARALKLDPNAYRKVSSVVAASEDASSEHGSLSKSHDDAKNPTSTDDSVLTSTPKEPSTPGKSLNMLSV